jgi:putative ABC transport system ATP-binding protein
MIHLKNINKTYKGIAGDVHALIDVDLELSRGESAAIIGKSGSGKSTLLNTISGIDRPESGELIINGTSLPTLSENELARWRGKNIGIVFQNYQLIPTLSAIDNILFAMDLVNVIKPSERRKRAIALLESVDLGTKSKKFPNELSGGEGQRVAIARALANDPPIVIADEPTGNLDSKTGEQIYSLFTDLRALGKNIIIVTHERVAERKFDQVITMQDGQLTKSQVFA